MALSALALLDAFKARHSIRQFEQGSLDAGKVPAIDSAIAAANGLPTPFGNSGELATFPAGLGLGSITNEIGWIIAKVPRRANSPQAIIDVSFRLHYALMLLTQAGLGTIWISGTFTPQKAESAHPGFAVPCAIAYGLVPGTKYLKPRADWTASRKPEAQVIAIPDPTNVIALNASFAAALRSGPSAMNRQPWRFVFIGNLIHLYNAGTSESANFDMGIALANIRLLAQDEEKSVEFVAVEDPPGSPIGGQYVVSARLT
jgi:nitroreductase